MRVVYIAATGDWTNIFNYFIMSERIRIRTLEPEAYKIMYEFEDYLNKSQVTKIHRELIKIRASQINGCAFCLNMHTKNAREAGETEQRIYLLDAWRDAQVFTEEEKAILALTEEVTLIRHGVSDETYENALKLLGEKYLAQVIMTITVINAWNRILVSTKVPPAL